MTVEITRINPDTMPPSTGYTQVMQVTNAERRVVISGQVGVAPDGTVPNTGEGQIAQAFANLRAALAAVDMTTANIVKITVFLTDRALLGSYRAARTMVLGDHPPASTLIFISGLVDPRWVVEIEAEAAG